MLITDSVFRSSTESVQYMYCSLGKEKLHLCDGLEPATFCFLQILPAVDESLWLEVRVLEAIYRRCSLQDVVAKVCLCLSLLFYDLIHFDSAFFGFDSLGDMLPVPLGDINDLTVDVWVGHVSWYLE